MGVKEGARPWTSSAEFQGIGVKHTARCLEIIDLVALQTMVWSPYRDPVKKGQRDRVWMKNQLNKVLVDLSQNPVRRCFTKNGKTPCLTTSSMIYSFSRDSALLPLEHMLLQGHRRTISIPDQMSGKQLKELAGEGMSLPCLALLVWCLVLVNRLP